MKKAKLQDFSAFDWIMFLILAPIVIIFYLTSSFIFFLKIFYAFAGIFLIVEALWKLTVPPIKDGIIQAFRFTKQKMLGY